MCGRYALGVRMNFVRRRLQEQGMPVDEMPEDDDVRETYNFAPGNIGAVYRADVPDGNENTEPQAETEQGPAEPTDATEPNSSESATKSAHYKLQSMKWGLVPFWTKRQPDYGSLMRTINCRDDSLIEERGMWTSMKRKKRCVVVCQGYYEWEKRGKDKIPHYTRRRDEDLMYFAGLWDCVSYEGSDEKLYTYTVITTSARPSLSWLHDRMPVILDPKSEAWNAWLDPKRTSWSKDLQAALKPYEGELECYQVPKEVGKVGNNSPDFIVPIDSKENKSNIANFFANAKKSEPTKEEGEGVAAKKEDDKAQPGAGVKREYSDGVEDATNGETKKQKTQASPSSSPTKPSAQGPAAKQKQMRSATHNQKPSKKPGSKKATKGTPRITNFFFSK
ncbi:SOS response-associated peptidase [Aspergillus undulatus]|uniref:SOS response-associated peptidase n=1 Tax=Aspergillus undulatus TaxID=1810928 RepID=UPI003CCE3518